MLSRWQYILKKLLLFHTSDGATVDRKAMTYIKTHWQVERTVYVRRVDMLLKTPCSWAITSFHTSAHGVKTWEWVRGQQTQTIAHLVIYFPVLVMEGIQFHYVFVDKNLVAAFAIIINIIYALYINSWRKLHFPFLSSSWVLYQHTECRSKMKAPFEEEPILVFRLCPPP